DLAGVCAAAGRSRPAEAMGGVAPRLRGAGVCAGGAFVPHHHDRRHPAGIAAAFPVPAAAATRLPRCGSCARRVAAVAHAQRCAGSHARQDPDADRRAARTFCAHTHSGAGRSAALPADHRGRRQSRHGERAAAPGGDSDRDDAVRSTTRRRRHRASLKHQGEDMRLRVARVRRHGLVRRGVLSGVFAAALLQAVGSGAAPAPAAATAEGAVNPSLFGALQWRGIGPYRGGRALAVAGVPGDATRFYFGAVAGGVWRTTDGGGTWEVLTDGTPISSVGAMAIAPSNHDVIYVGTGEAAPRGNMTYGDGVYRSADGGRSWSHVGLRDSRQIGALIIDPGNPDIVLVAALGHAFGPNTERGVFRTTDGGKSWTKVLYKDENTGAIDVSFDPRDSRIVYAALWQARRQPWNFSSGGPGSGLYRSTDGGVSWKQLTGNGLPAGILGRIHVSVSAAD